MSGKTARRNRKNDQKKQEPTMSKVFADCVDENGWLDPSSPSVISVCHPPYGDDKHAPFDADPLVRGYANAVWSKLSEADKKGFTEVRRIASMMWQAAIAPYEDPRTTSLLFQGYLADTPSPFVAVPTEHGRWSYARIAHLVLCFNHKIWQHWEAKNYDLTEYYDGLWRYTDDWCFNHLSGKSLSYFIRYQDLIGTALWFS